MGSRLGEPSCSKDYNPVFLDVQVVVQRLNLFLKPLDDLLRCHICFEYYNSCMITKCSHGYCSLCIRKFMTYKSQCPECFQEAAEPELRSNRQIDEVLCVYKKIKSYLDAFHGNAFYSQRFNDSLPDDALSSRCDNLEGNSEISSVYHSQGSPGKETRNYIVEADSYKKPSDKDLFTTSRKVACPACATLVFPETINAHLDMCLSGQASTPQKKEKRKPLPKVVYHLLSDKDIKKRLKEHGLNTFGTRQCLIKRHKNFLVLYNSECDSLNPRPVSELVRQIESEETELRSNESVKLFHCDKKSSPDAITEEHEEYLKHNKQHFDALVNDIRIRQQQQMRSEAGLHKQDRVIQDMDVDISCLTPIVLIDTPHPSNDADNSAGSPVLFSSGSPEGRASKTEEQRNVNYSELVDGSEPNSPADISESPLSETAASPEDSSNQSSSSRGRDGRHTRIKRTRAAKRKVNNSTSDSKS